jgi:hypothetical protein
MLSRKTYEAQAAIIAKHVEAGKVERDHLYEMATDLANYYAKDNPRFDRTRFFEACGFPGGFHLRVVPVEYVDAVN